MSEIGTAVHSSRDAKLHELWASLLFWSEAERETNWINEDGTRSKKSMSTKLSEDIIRIHLSEILSSKEINGAKFTASQIRIDAVNDY